MTRPPDRRFAAAVLAAGILCAPGCGKTGPKTTGERETRVTVEPLTRRIFRRTVPVQGTVYPVEYATISAKISGTLELLKVDEGDSRAKGDVLFGIDRQVLANQVTMREDEIKVKTAEFESAKIAEQIAVISRRKAGLDYERSLRLWNSKATSLAEFEAYETSFKKAEMDVQSAKAAVINAEAQLKQAESNLTIARKNLDDSVITAPFDCIVTDKYVEENEFVSIGQNILKLENQKKLEIECYISAVYYDLIVPGKTPALFKSGGRALVTYKAPSIDPESRTFKIKILVPEDIRLVSGMLCSLTLVLEEKEAYGLPSDAILLRANDRYIAYTADDRNRAKSVDIVRGIVDGKYCEVENYAGLLGRRFVITGQTFINNGALLKVVNGK